MLTIIFICFALVTGKVSNHYINVIHTVQLCLLSCIKTYYFSSYSYYRGTHGVIVVYDVSSGESFANVKRWLHEIEQNCDVVNRILGKIRGQTEHNKILTLFFYLVGNKDDMPDRKVVLTEDAQRFASQMGIQLFETSAKDNKNVEEMFNAITQQVLLTKKEQKEQASNLNDTITVGKGRKPTKKSKCC